MKQILLIMISISLFIPCVVNALEVTPNAKSSVLISYDSGEVLYSKDKDTRRSVASLTKMMGLIIIFENIESGKLHYDDLLIVSSTAKEMGGTQIWLSEGEKISVDDLLKGVTMASANDAMVLLAEKISGSEQEFVKLMNKKAQDLKLKNTHFVNCTGFDEDGNYSSAYDMAIIGKELIKHKDVLKYTGKYEDYIRDNTDNKSWIVNTNKLVKFYPGVDGLKTGYEESAGSTICVTSLKNNLRLIGVSLGYSNTKDRNNEMMNLLDYGYRNYEAVIIKKRGEVIKRVKVPKSFNDEINLVLKDNVVLIKKKKDKKDYTYEYKIRNIDLPIRRGDKIGSFVLKKDDKVLSDISIITNKTYEKTNFFKQYLAIILNYFTGF